MKIILSNMKKTKGTIIRILTLLFTVVMLTNGQMMAQNYQALPDSNATWIVEDRSSQATTFSTFRIGHSSEDTVINGFHYMKVFGSLALSKDGEGYWGALRNDGYGRSYYIPKNTTVEKLQQDFSKVKGDTIFDVAYFPPDGTYNGPYNFIVDSVTSLPNGSNSLKYMSLHAINDILQRLIWIEKIGCTNGGIMNNCSCVGLNVSNLSCMSASDTLFYESDWYNFSSNNVIHKQGNCNNYLEVDKPNPDQDFTAWPNPSDGRFYVISHKVSGPMVVRIYSMMGREILEKTIANFSNQYEIVLPSGLSPGNYLLTIEAKKKQIWKQIVTKE